MSEVTLINADETTPFNEHNLDSVLSNPDYARHRQALLKRCHDGKRPLQPATAGAPLGDLEEDLLLLCLQGQGALCGLLDAEPASPLQRCRTRYASCAAPRDVGCRNAACLLQGLQHAQMLPPHHGQAAVVHVGKACDFLKLLPFCDATRAASPTMQAGLGCPWYCLCCWRYGTQRSLALAAGSLQPPAPCRRMHCSERSWGWRSTLLRVRPVSLLPCCCHGMSFCTDMTRQLRDGASWGHTLLTLAPEAELGFAPT